MKALTLHQPWASLIALGVKTLETRSWSTKYRGPLAIHAAVKVTKPWMQIKDWVWVYQPLTSDTCALWRDSDVELTGNSQEIHYLPLGAIVATCELVDVVEMFDGFEQANFRRIEVDHNGSPWLCEAEDEDSENYLAQDRVDVSDQRPYGDFTPGRYAWILEDVKPIDPIPAKGRQGLWNWEPDADR